MAANELRCPSCGNALRAQDGDVHVGAPTPLKLVKFYRCESEGLDYEWLEGREPALKLRLPTVAEAVDRLRRTDD